MIRAPMSTKRLHIHPLDFCSFLEMDRKCFSQIQGEWPTCVFHTLQPCVISRSQSPACYYSVRGLAAGCCARQSTRMDKLLSCSISAIPIFLPTLLALGLSPLSLQFHIFQPPPHLSLDLQVSHFPAFLFISSGLASKAMETQQSLWSRMDACSLPAVVQPFPFPGSLFW